MKKFRPQNCARLMVAAWTLLIVAAAPHAGTVTGLITNGTDNKPAAGIDVILIQLQNGMQPVANTKTDSAGRYSFDNAAIGAGPMLIRAIYKGVMFHQPLVPGTPTVDVMVYEPTTSPKALEVSVRLIVLQPNNDKLMIGEEYSIQNGTSPPSAYFKQDGDFQFMVPKDADLQQVSAFGPAGMPVVQGTIDKGKGNYAIAYAFQPGQNGVRFSYLVPYTGNQATLHIGSAYDSQRVLLVVPPTMQISSPGFSPAGTEQGFNVYQREGVKAGSSFDVAVSGTAPPPSEAQQEAPQGGPEAGTPDQLNGRDAGPTVTDVPARLDDQKWILLGGLTAIFAVGVAFLWRQPVVAAVTAPVPAAAGPRMKEKPRAAPPAPVIASAAAKAAPPPATVTERVTQEVNMSLDSLKDTLLRIELRRQAGTMSEEEYARERGRAEQLLRELVQG
jgi:hypothetical protein